MLAARLAGRAADVLLRQLALVDNNDMLVGVLGQLCRQRRRHRRGQRAHRVGAADAALASTAWLATRAGTAPTATAAVSSLRRARRAGRRLFLIICMPTVPHFSEELNPSRTLAEARALTMIEAKTSCYLALLTMV